MHMDMSQEPISCENLQVKCRRPDVSRTFCASLRGRNAHGHVTRAHFIRKFMGKNAGQRTEHPDQALSLTPTVSNPSVWTQCLRERKRPSNGLKASFSLVNVAFRVYTLYLVVTPKMKEVALAFPPLPLGLNFLSRWPQEKFNKYRNPKKQDRKVMFPTFLWNFVFLLGEML